MGRFDDTLKWLREQVAHATEALADLKGGQTIHINDEDVTSWWVARYEDTIERLKTLIGAYEKKND